MEYQSSTRCFHITSDCNLLAASSCTATQPPGPCPAWGGLSADYMDRVKVQEKSEANMSLCCLNSLEKIQSTGQVFAPPAWEQGRPQLASQAESTLLQASGQQARNSCDCSRLQTACQ